MADARALPRLMTTDEFVAWVESRPEGKRWELIDGVPVAMAPERSGHARAKGRAFRALGEAIAARNLRCEAFVEGMAVRVDDRSTDAPDALVRWGDPLPDDAILVTEPLIVVEILSPSTANDDLAGRLDGCFRIPSRRHDLILKTSNRTAIHHARDASGRITTQLLQAPDALTLDPPGLVLPVASLFA